MSFKNLISREDALNLLPEEVSNVLSTAFFVGGDTQPNPTLIPKHLIPQPTPEEAYLRRVEELEGLSPRIRNALGRAGYTRRAQIARTSDARLRAVPGIGDLSLRQIRYVIPREIEPRILPPPVKLIACSHCGGTGWMTSRDSVNPAIDNSD